jgi:hypothetical protein
VDSQRVPRNPHNPPPGDRIAGHRHDDNHRGRHNREDDQRSRLSRSLLRAPKGHGRKHLESSHRSAMSGRCQGRGLIWWETTLPGLTRRSILGCQCHTDTAGARSVTQNAGRKGTRAPRRMNHWWSWSPQQRSS